MQKNSVKPSSSPRVLSAQWLEHFQLFEHPPYLKEVVTDVGLISPSNSENLFRTSSTLSQGIILYLIHTRVHATLPIVHMIVLLSLTSMYSNNNLNLS